VANAGSDLSVTGPTEVTLNGSASHDPENGALTYSWKQVSGPQAALLDATQAKARVVLDAVSADINLVFELAVTDDHNLTARDQVVVTNKAPQPNLPPLVSLPATASVESGKQVTLKATASDPNGDPLTYQWTVPAGLTASGQNSATLVVTGPNVTSDTAYDLSLTVSDGALDASAATRLTVSRSAVVAVARPPIRMPPTGLPGRRARSTTAVKGEPQPAGVAGQVLDSGQRTEPHCRSVDAGEQGATGVGCQCRLQQR